MVPPDIPPAPSSTLWATASKEWVIPEKPKPGRKPKKDAATAAQSVCDPLPDTTDSKGRRVQNRAAQRAFRERKQTQLADLQARIQQYEQGEIERNVALQAVAKKLKEENEALRNDNAKLRADLSSLRAQLDDKKRLREDDPMRGDPTQSKRQRCDSNLPASSTLVTTLSQATSPLSILSSPSPVSPQSEYTKQSSFQTLSTPTSHFPLDGFVDCGFCTDDGPCVCRELAMQESVYELSPVLRTTIKEDEGLSPDTKIDTKASILDNLPAFQPAVPLKKRNGPKPPSVFKTFEAAPTCSGDPNNCRACADDPFGRAFCAALGDAVASTSRCTNCPAGGCGKPGSKREPEMPPASSTELVPRAEAWRQLKSHPNAAFADLRLLAEVIARKTGCSGPTIDLETVTHCGPGERGDGGPNEPEATVPDPGHEVTQQRALGKSRADAPCLVPQEVLIRCGRGRALDVQAEGVREALRLLDSRAARLFHGANPSE